MGQNKVLSVGIKSTANLGDVAISEMIFTLLTNRGYLVEQMEFNFSAVAEEFFRVRSRQVFSKDSCARIKTETGNRLGLKLLKSLGRVFKLTFYLPIVFLVFLRKAKNCSMVIIGGGNLLMGIEYGFPLQVLAYVLFSRLVGKRVVFVCVGAGPFTAPGIKPILRMTLWLAHRVICRDTKSVDLIERELGDSLVALDVLADPVLLWPKLKEETKIKYDMLFTVMPLFSPAIFPDGDGTRAKNFKSCMTDLAVELIKLGKRVGVFVTDSSVDLEISKMIAEDVFNRAGVRLEVQVPDTPAEMALLVNSAEVVFSTRMHGAIMALSQSVPALCVCWQLKIRGLYSDLAIDDLLVELDERGRFSILEVLDMISNITENRKNRILGVEEKLSALERQYKRLWAGL